jgi:hypothetical protein
MTQNKSWIGLGSILAPYILDDTFDSSEMGFLGISLKASTKTNTYDQSNIRPAC